MGGFRTSELDGDVTTMEGNITAHIADLNYKNRNKDIYSVIGMGLNHNYSNSMIKSNDNNGHYSQEKAKKQYSRKVQENFTKNLIGDFSQYAFGKEVNNKLFEGSFVEPYKMYGVEVINEALIAGRAELFRPRDLSNVSLDGVRLRVGYTSPVMDKKAEIDYYVPQSGDKIYRKLYAARLSYDKKGSAFSVAVKNGDFSNKKALLLNLITSPAALSNNKEPQEFTLRIRDENGKTAHIAIEKDHMALRQWEGKIENTGEDRLFSEITPFGAIRIPLNLIKDEVDLSKIKSVDLVFDAKDKGEIILKNIEIY